MAIKNFKNKLTQAGPNLSNPFKDPALAADFNLTDFDDFQSSRSLKNNKRENLDQLPDQNNAMHLNNTLQNRNRCFKRQEETTEELVANRVQTGSKLVANQVQTGSKLVANQVQTGSKLVANRVQTGSKLVANQVQTGSSSFTATKAFSALSGIQRSIVSFLYEDCKRICNTVTDQIRVNNLKKINKNVDLSTIKNALNRLTKKGIISRVEYKNGLGGWTRYQLSEAVYQEIRDLELTDKLGKLDEHSGKPIEIGSNSSNVSALEDFKNKTLEKEQKNQVYTLPPEWEKVDYSDLECIHFKKQHLLQWFTRNDCTAQAAQESIWHYALFLKNTSKEEQPSNPLNYLMEIMSQYHYFSKPDGYLSPQEQGLKLQVEEQKKAFQIKLKLQEELFEAKFEIWLASLPRSLINELTPQYNTLEDKKSVLREKFRDQHWLTIKDNPNIDVIDLNCEGIASHLEKKSLLNIVETPENELSQTSLLKFKVEQFRKYCEKYPDDLLTAEKLKNREAELSQIQKGQELTQDEIKAACEARF